METRGLEPVKQLGNRKIHPRSKGNLKEEREEKTSSRMISFFHFLDSLTLTPCRYFHGIKK